MQCMRLYCQLWSLVILLHFPPHNTEVAADQIILLSVHPDSHPQLKSGKSGSGIPLFGLIIAPIFFANV